MTRTFFECPFRVLGLHFLNLVEVMKLAKTEVLYSDCARIFRQTQFLYVDLNRDILTAILEKFHTIITC